MQKLPENQTAFHVFVVNNFFSFLMHCRLIRLYNWSAKDCLFVTVRKFKLPEHFKEQGFESVDFSAAVEISSRGWLVRHLFRPWKAWRIRKNIHDAIDAHSGGRDYDIFIYHSGSLTSDILVCSRKCRGYWFVEEGLVAYTQHLAAEKPERSLPVYLSESYLLPFCAHKLSKWRFNRRSELYRGTFASCPEAFPEFPERTVIGLPFSELETTPPDCRNVIVFDGGILSPDEEKANFELHLQRISERKEPVACYKFHPAWDEAKKALFREWFRDLERKYGIGIVELPSDLILENLAFTLKEKLSVHVLISSVGFYSALCGCHVYTSVKHFGRVLRRWNGIYGNLDPGVAGKLEYI